MPTVTVDLEKCDGDGVCADVCPMNVFDIVKIDGDSKSQPTRADDCILCMACVNACPQGALTVEE